MSRRVEPLPEPAPGIETARLLGAWYVLITNDEFWRAHTHPRVDLDALAPDSEGRARIQHALRFRARDLLGRTTRELRVATDLAERDGQFVSRGQGLRRVVVQRWSVPLVGPNYRWIVTWRARSKLGARPGLSVHTRDPSIPQALLDEILAQIRAHPFLSAAEDPRHGPRCARLFAPVQDWIPPQPYRLD
ncbi:hypothetical protein ENSA5_40450 [Enhygromyxa salina]|uniref:Uncharacterized protein n=1 Tax=Enhygromyxa salina TaxID=215803 RepID=A0A2S9XPD5_9BACT|nr:hypothetical protein [Enhygromyxa salina]PRP94722.1 hypothetical protein ENSA5_40450 [Enhygromyxa salina]